MKINENYITAIIESTPRFMRGNRISSRAIKQGQYKALDIYLEQFQGMQGGTCQLVVVCNGRIL